MPSEWLGRMKMSAAAFRVYFALAHHANRHTWEAWPTYERIIELTGLSRDSVARALRELAYAGLIRVLPASGGHHPSGFRHNTYTVNLGSAGPWPPQVVEKRKRRSKPASRPAEASVASITADTAAETRQAHDAHLSAVSDTRQSAASDTPSPRLAEARVRDLGDKQSYGNTPTVHPKDQPTPTAGLRKRSPAMKGRKGEPREFTRLIRMLEIVDDDDLRDPARSLALAVWVQRPDWRYGLKLCALSALRYKETHGGTALGVFVTKLNDREHLNPSEARYDALEAWGVYFAIRAGRAYSRADLDRLFAEPPSNDLPIVCDIDLRRELIEIASFHGFVLDSDQAA